ncbi:unnamed protein product [Choristocarpus tenellus]
MAAFDTAGNDQGTGLAKTIRTSAVSDTYDLAGYGEAQVRELVKDAFSLPVPASEAFRVTFVTGGGKAQNRQRYDSDLGRYLTSSLRELGFMEDRAATTLMECQGLYKSQHDTHKGIRMLQVGKDVIIWAVDVCSWVRAVRGSRLCGEVV